MVIAALLLASIVEGIGLASLVPLLTIVANQQGAPPSPLLTVIRESLATVGLPMSIGVLILMLATAMTLKSVLRFFALRHVGYAVANFTTDLRTQVIDNLLNASWPFLIHQRIGRITTAIAGQASRAGGSFALAATFIAQAIQTAAYLVMAFMVSWPIAIAAIGIGTIMAVSLHSLVLLARKAGTDQTQQTKQLITFMTDGLSNLKPLKAMAKQEDFSRLLAKKVRQVRKALKQSVLSTEGLKNSQDILITLALCLGFYLAVEKWKLPIVNLAVVGMLMKKSMNSITKMQKAYQGALIGESAYHDIMELVAESSSQPEINPGKQKACFDKECRLEDVSLAHGDHIVLNHVSMELLRGEVIVLTGPSGSGKTTLADIILGLIVPDSGIMKIDGIPLEEIDLFSWRRLIGYVPQELVLFHDTIFQNISLGDPSLDETRVEEALKTAGAWEFVSRMPKGVYSVVGERGAKLSGGQRQRIALARALVCKPKLLILDEVTSALDPKTEMEVIDRIRQISQEVTILSITHRMAFLDIADQVYHLEQGHLRKLGKDTLQPQTQWASGELTG